MKKNIINFSIEHPWIVIIGTLLITIFFLFQFPKIQIDTDPQNMLEEHEPTRLFHAFTKDQFNLYDFIAVGIVKEPSAFTAETLNRLYNITSEILDIDGVISEDVMAPSTVDDIKQGSNGVLVIKPLQEDEIETNEEALEILSRIKSNPILRGKLASEDGQAIAIFIPIASKDYSHRISKSIEEIVGRIDSSGTKYYIAGLPLAEDSFGAEMFTQMAISAPIAMAIIFLLTFVFFRNAKMLIAMMVVAMVSVIWSMGLLISMGFKVHIMSSMIPIFLLPIAVLDSIHILSEFTEAYQRTGNKKDALRQSIGELFLPMLFTSLTTVAGFLSLALTPIPPVQVFGVFVAFGIAVAWFLSLVLNPAFIMLIPEKSLQKLRITDESHGLLARMMHSFRNLSRNHGKAIIIGAGLLAVVSAYGLTKIVVNDNPVKWFKPSHPIRVADKIMNEHLAGTYMNYLVFESNEPDMMKTPMVERYIESMQRELEKEPVVGSTTGLPDIIKKIRFELYAEDSAKLKLPESQDEIAQLLFLFEMSGGDPDDLFKFVTDDYEDANLWVQLRKGDNMAVSAVVDRGNRFIESNPPPKGVKVKWAGLPYINIAWQDQMVTGMGKSLLSSFAVVLIMMVFLFRSLRWGFLSMLPLTLTIMTIYALIGYIGKPYDMPVAVLSSLTLGLSVDFAIHFIQRMRMIYKQVGSFDEAFNQIFEGTGRAISKNVLVIAIGFVPMLFSSLVPYITVGSFFLAIMIVSGLVTLLLLPAFAVTFKKSLFPALETAGNSDPASESGSSGENK